MRWTQLAVVGQGAGWIASFVSLCGAPFSHSPLATPAAPQGIKKMFKALKIRGLPPGASGKSITALV